MINNQKDEKMIFFFFLPWPGVNTGNFKTVVPGTGVFSLAFETGADAVSVCFSVLPTAAVHSSIIEIEPATLDRFLRAAAHASADSADSAAAGHTRRRVRLHFGLLAPPPISNIKLFIIFETRDIHV